MRDRICDVIDKNRYTVQIKLHLNTIYEVPNAYSAILEYNVIWLCDPDTSLFHSSLYMVIYEFQRLTCKSITWFFF